VVQAAAELAKVRLGSRVAQEQARAGAEERLMRLADVEATVADFNTKVVVGAVHERFGTHQAEKVVRWLEDQARGKAKQVERLRIETAGLRARIRAVTQAAQLCAEKGEDEGDQDPAQLSLQKQNFLRQLQEKDKLLVDNKRKLVTAQRKKYSTQQNLKQELKREKELEASITEKESLILDMEDKVKAIKTANEKLTVSNEKLKEKIATHAVPSIDEYINLKLKLESEQKKAKMFERKINIKKLIERNQTIKKTRPHKPIFVQQDIVL
jgi:hypothetical protein